MDSLQLLYSPCMCPKFYNLNSVFFCYSTFAVHSKVYCLPNENIRIREQQVFNSCFKHSMFILFIYGAWSFQQTQILKFLGTVNLIFNSSIVSTVYTSVYLYQLLWFKWSHIKKKNFDNYCLCDIVGSNPDFYTFFCMAFSGAKSTTKIFKDFCHFAPIIKI